MKFSEENMRMTKPYMEVLKRHKAIQSITSTFNKWYFIYKDFNEDQREIWMSDLFDEDKYVVRPRIYKFKIKDNRIVDEKCKIGRYKKYAEYRTRNLQEFEAAIFKLEALLKKYEILKKKAKINELFTKE